MFKDWQSFRKSFKGYNSLTKDEKIDLRKIFDARASASGEAADDLDRRARALIRVGNDRAAEAAEKREEAEAEAFERAEAMKAAENDPRAMRGDPADDVRNNRDPIVEEPTA